MYVEAAYYVEAALKYIAQGPCFIFVSC